MLSRECTVCRSPLFEIKGETVCVVCRDQDQTVEGKAVPHVQKAEKTKPIPGAGTSDLGREIEETIAALCRRARDEPDPNRCLALMDSVKIGVETLALLRQG